jgi:hypothetical protein
VDLENLLLAMFMQISPRTVAITLPKSGTHLLAKALDELGLVRRLAADRNLTENVTDDKDAIWLGVGSPQKKSYSEVYKCFAAVSSGEYAVAHLPHSEAAVKLLSALDFYKIILIRDPRDVAVSLCHFACLPVHPLSEYYRSLPSQDARLRASIEGVGWENYPLLNMGERLARILPWLREPNCLVVRFEDLVGEQGGGSRARQQAALREISDFLNLQLSRQDIIAVASRVFDRSSATFRRGEIGEWKKYFKPEHVETFKKIAGEQLIQLGYERDLDW